MLRRKGATMQFLVVAIAAMLLIGNVAYSQVIESGPGTADTSSIVLGNKTVETQVTPHGFRIQIHSNTGELSRSSTLSGNLHLDVGQRNYDFKLVPLADASLGTDVDLSRVVGYDLDITVELIGLNREPLNYKAKLRISELLSDAFLLKLQQRCPVSGKELDINENHKKLMIDERPLFVCCDGCAAVVNNDPQKYVNKVYGEAGREIRPGVFEATLADAKAIARQMQCPVLDERLDLVGVPLKVTVDGKSVFVACQGCTKFVQMEPEKYLLKFAQKQEKGELHR